MFYLSFFSLCFEHTFAPDSSEITAPMRVIHQMSGGDKNNDEQPFQSSGAKPYDSGALADGGRSNLKVHLGASRTWG